MDIEKLIERLNRYFEGKDLKRGVALDAATALSALQAENEKLREMYQKEKAVCHAVQAELEQVKRELQAYKDTGLEPEDFKRAFHEDAVLKLAGQALGIAPDRLRELAQAHKENRVLPEGSGWFVTCSGKKLTVVMDIEAALRREQDG